jgi:ketosteroid isomerase-like protein
MNRLRERKVRAMSDNQQDRQQITALLDQYRQGFAVLDAARLMRIWDQEYNQIIYIAQEKAEPVRGWEGVAQYYQRVVQLLEKAKTMELSDVSIDILGDVAYAFLNFHFESQINGHPHIADGRVTFLLHRTLIGWKAIHYHESRLGDQPS